MFRPKKGPAIASTFAVLALMAAACSSGFSNASSSNGSHPTVKKTADGNPPSNLTLNADLATTPSTCGILTWNGTDHRSRNFHAVVRPGSDYGYGAELDAYIIPGCGTSARDFVIDAGEGLRNAIGELVDDRHLPSPLGAPVYTKAGGGLPETPVYLELSVDWNLCQSYLCIKTFWTTMCQKFTCAGQPIDYKNPYPTNAGATSSPAGWNRMLAELFGGAIDKMVRALVPNYSAAITRDDAQGAKLLKQLGDAMSADFNQFLNGKTGSPYNLICGPGNSYFTTTGSDYHCALPRFTITSVDLASQDNYGEFGPYARQVAACQAVGSHCTMVLGNGGNLVVKQH